MPKFAKKGDVFPVHEDTAAEYLSNLRSEAGRREIETSARNIMNHGDSKLILLQNAIIDRWGLRQDLSNNFGLGFASAYKILRMQAKRSSDSVIPHSDDLFLSLFELDVVERMDADDFSLNHLEEVESDVHFHGALEGTSRAVSPDVCLTDEKRIILGGAVLYVVAMQHLDYKAAEQQLTRR